MLPESWKGQIQNAIKEEIDSDAQRRQSENNNNATNVTAAIIAVRDAQNAQTSHQDGSDRVKRGFDVVTIILVFMTVVFTGATWLAFREQLGEMKKVYEPIADQAKWTRESYTTVQRAFVTVSKLEIEQRIVAGPVADGKVPISLWWFTPFAENNGNTPTKDLQYISVASCMPMPFVFANPFQIVECQTGVGVAPLVPRDPEAVWGVYNKNETVGDAIIGPHATIPMGGIGVPSQFIEKIRGGFPWHIKGVIYYNDIFPDTQPHITQSHITKFCYIIRVDIRVDGSGNQSTRPAYDFCDGWNCADDECKQKPRPTSSKKGAPQLAPGPRPQFLVK